MELSETLNPQEHCGVPEIVGYLGKKVKRTAGARRPTIDLWHGEQLTGGGLRFAQPSPCISVKCPRRRCHLSVVPFFCYFLLIFCQSQTPARIPTTIHTSPPATIKKLAPPPYPIIPYPPPQFSKQALASAGTRSASPIIVNLIMVVISNYATDLYFKYTPFSK